MLQPNRAFSSGNSYRYGFGGKEKASEITGDDYDFGERIYDSRLGRWLSMDKLKDIYSAFSPYNFTVSNPMSFVDNDGKIVIDGNKNIVAKSTNTFKTVEHMAKDGSKLVVKYERIKILADDGSEAEVLVLSKATLIQKTGKQIPYKNIEQFKANCHGLTFTKGRAWIEDGEALKNIITGDYQPKAVQRTLNGSEVDDSKTTNGDVVLVGFFESDNLEDIDADAIWHSAKKNNNTSYDQKDDIAPKESNVSIKKVRNYNNSAKRDKGLGALFIRKKGNDKKVAAKGDTKKYSGFTVVSDEEFEKIKSKVKSN